MNTTAANAMATHRSTRRHLWDLPATAHDLLLAMGLPPLVMRRTLQQAMGRVRGARCVIQGSETDVLYSAVHDLGQRNAVSEALERALQRAHGQAVAQMSRLRDAPALRAAWVAAWRQGDVPGNVPGALWALLTHPLGPALQDAALRDARAWVFEMARHGLNCRRTTQATDLRADQAEAENQRLRLRMAAHHGEHQAQVAGLQAELIRLRGEGMRLQDTLARHTLASAAGPVEAPCGAQKAAVQTGPAAPAGAPPPPSSHSLHSPHSPHSAPSPPPPPSAATNASAKAASAGICVSGQRVLCVGGMPGAQARYRAIVESAGGRFAFHDGGLEDNVQRLGQQLLAADVVVCQAGCLNHEAYKRVKSLCQRLDKPCLYLKRPSLTQFADTLRAPTATVADTGQPAP